MSHKAGFCVSRGMLVVDATLQTIIFLMIVVTDGDWDRLGWVWDRRGVWLASGCLWGDVFSSVDAVACAQQLQETVSKFIVELSRLCTAELWLQFVHDMETIWLCIRAEHLCDWLLHEYAAARMLKLFAASGHFIYVISAMLYVQIVQELADRTNILSSVTSLKIMACSQLADLIGHGQASGQTLLLNIPLRVVMVISFAAVNTLLWACVVDWWHVTIQNPISRVNGALTPQQSVQGSLSWLKDLCHVLPVTRQLILLIWTYTSSHIYVQRPHDEETCHVCIGST